jgi:hypothetical protein
MKAGPFQRINEITAGRRTSANVTFYDTWDGSRSPTAATAYYRDGSVKLIRADDGVPSQGPRS